MFALKKMMRLGDCATNHLEVWVDHGSDQIEEAHPLAACSVRSSSGVAGAHARRGMARWASPVRTVLEWASSVEEHAR